MNDEQVQPEPEHEPPRLVNQAEVIDTGLRVPRVRQWLYRHFGFSKYADPPHPIALLVSLVGPVLTLASLMIAYNSLLLSRDSLREARVQRERLQSEFAPSLRVAGDTVIEPYQIYDLLTDTVRPHFKAEFRLKIENTGKSPAQLQ